MEKLGVSLGKPRCVRYGDFCHCCFCQLCRRIKGRRKDKDFTPCVVADLHDNGRSYLDDELTQEIIVDADLSALVFRPVGVEHNEWLATHSESTYF